MPINSEILAKHMNPVFVETGSLTGEGIQTALNAGFGEVHSIELSPRYCDYCKNRFLSNSKVKIYSGDSTKVLWDIIATIEEPATFWLDGHHCGGDTGHGDKSSPLLEELDIIARHPIKTHTILIDDLRVFAISNPEYGFGINEIMEKIKAINPDYQTAKTNSPLFKDDILVASVKKENT